MPKARTVVPKKCKKYLRYLPKILLWHIWYFERCICMNTLVLFFYVLFCTETSSSTVEKQFGYTTTVLLTHSSAMKYNDCPSLFPVMNYFTFNIKFNNHLYTNLNFYEILCFLRSFQTHPMWSTALLFLEAKT